MNGLYAHLNMVCTRQCLNQTSSCFSTQDPKTRPPAKHLLLHKFIARTAPDAQTQLVPLIAAAVRVAAARGPLQEASAAAATAVGTPGGPGEAKGPWARPSAGWGRFAGLAFGGRQVWALLSGAHSTASTCM